jgi:hypothetical protein
MATRLHERGASREVISGSNAMTESESSMRNMKAATLKGI